MKKYFTKFLRFNKIVNGEGTEYECLDYPHCEVDTVKAVKSSVYDRYELLSAWKRNKLITPEQVVEMEGYVETLDTADIIPVDTIRICDKNWDTLFEIRNMSEIQITVPWNNSTNTYLAVRDDEYHTTLYRKKEDVTYGYSDVFHIHQMGEIAGKNDWIIRPLETEVVK